MNFDTKVVLVIRTDLETWQKVNVAAFLASGIVAEFPESIGDPYEDGSGTEYTRLLGQPVFVYGGDSAALARALERALNRGVKPSVYTKEMFSTGNDIDNREAVKAVTKEKLDLVGLAFRADKKVIDKIVDKLEFLK